MSSYLRTVLSVFGLERDEAAGGWRKLYDEKRTDTVKNFWNAERGEHFFTSLTTVSVSATAR
jgi:hypothetical protein